MDTHDAATMSHDRPLEAGVVLTIEPGLYIPDREEFGALAGIGVRLEDDVAVTIDGAEVLSAAVPLEPKEVEAMVGSGL
jgi:Xaa-Pro aminopeptidase